MQIPANNLPMHNTTWMLRRCMVQYMTRAQNRIGSDTRGAKYQLLVNRAVLGTTKSGEKKKLCTTWTNYKKVYESLECLELYDIHRTLTK